jgi:hypothetical protein
MPSATRKIATVIPKPVPSLRLSDQELNVRMADPLSEVVRGNHAGQSDTRDGA